MAEDNGLWFVNGKVSSARVRDRVWRIFDEAWSKLYDRRQVLEARHRRELAKLDKELLKLQKKRPLTPWVGRVDDGAVPKFVEDAKRLVEIHERQLLSLK